MQMCKIIFMFGKYFTNLFFGKRVPRKKNAVSIKITEINFFIF